MHTIPAFASHLLTHISSANNLISSTENTPLLPFHNTSSLNPHNSFLNEKTAYQTICSSTGECDTNNQAKKPVGIKEALFYFCLGFPTGVLISLVASGRVF